MIKIMFMDLVKSFDGILEWHDGDIAFHYKRNKVISVIEPNANQLGTNAAKSSFRGSKC